MYNRKKFKKGTAKNEKAITLIALIVSIIVLLILAGVSIAVLTGENGIINRTTQAKKTTEDAEVAEKIRLAFLNAQIGKYAGKNEDFAAVMQAELVKTLGAGATVTSNGTGFLVTYGDMKFDVSNTGAVERKSGVIITQKVEKIKNGSTAQVTASVDPGITGTISWKSSDDTIVKVTGSGTNATIEGMASSGSAIITAYIAGTIHEDKFTVNIAQAITAISASAISIGTGETATIVINTTPNSGILEDITYTFASNDTDVAIVDANGVVTGAGVGNTTITIHPSNGLDDINCSVEVTQSVGKFKTVDGVAYYYTGSTPTSGTAIDSASKMEQYLGKKVDYTTGGTYRIFYIDVNGDYGNAGTIYLKADYNSSRTLNLNSYKSYTPSDISATSKLAKMNPDWYSNRGTSSSSWNTNEHCAAYLCDPTTSSNTSNQAWASYFDSSKADFVIGSPSAEMYCDSYSVASHTGTGVTGNYAFEAVYSSSSYPGYKYKYTDLSVANATPVTNAYTPYEGDGSLDFSTKYKNMYCGVNGAKTGNWWLASPSSNIYDGVCFVGGDYAYLDCYPYNYTLELCPLVSLKSGVALTEVAE